MESIQHLNLTERDFDLIVAGLDVLPKAGETSELVGDIMVGLLTSDNAEAKQRFMAERKREQLKKEGEQRLLKEDIKILQGKLLTLKRWLAEQGALKEFTDILNKPTP